MKLRRTSEDFPSVFGAGLMKMIAIVTISGSMMAHTPPAYMYSFFLHVQAHTPLRAQNDKCTTSWYHKSKNTNVGVLKSYGKHNPVSVGSEKIKKIRGR